MVEKLKVFIGEFTIACSFRSLEDHFLWDFAGVYGPNLGSDKSLLQDEFARNQSCWEVLGV